MTRFLVICAGGALGTGARYLLSTWITRARGPEFPWGTLSVNLIGSFAIALVMALSRKSGVVSEDLRLFLVTGVLGGFTTYSAFSYESTVLLQQGSGGLALLNVAATLLGCFAAVALGFLVAQLLGPWSG